MLKLATSALAFAAAFGFSAPIFAQDATAEPKTEAPAEAAATVDATADTVVATVNGQDITIGQMIALRSQLPGQYQSMPDDVLFTGILDQLIQQVVLSQTTEKSITRLDELVIENSRISYLSSKVLQNAVLEATTEDALKKAYDAKYAAVEPAKEYHASHILVATEEEAKAIKADLDAGGDFAAIAREKSSDGSAQGGGDLGWFGLGMMVKPFEDAVLKLETGKISDPVQTEFGWHIIKLTETRMAAAPTLEDVREELTNEVQNAAADAKVNELMAAAKVERKADGIKPEVLRDAALLDK